MAGADVPLHLTVVQRGKLREPHYQALCEDYRQRFRRFGTLEVVEAEPRSGRPIWPEHTRFRVLLDMDGKTYSSPALAQTVDSWVQAHGRLAFAIGGADGHDPATRTTAQAAWSLGPMTLPHHLAHLVVIEQLYRAATILAGLPYHHGGRE